MNLCQIKKLDCLGNPPPLTIFKFLVFQLKEERRKERIKNRKEVAKKGNKKNTDDIPNESEFEEEDFDNKSFDSLSSFTSDVTNQVGSVGNSVTSGVSVSSFSTLSIQDLYRFNQALNCDEILIIFILENIRRFDQLNRTVDIYRSTSTHCRIFFWTSPGKL